VRFALETLLRFSSSACPFCYMQQFGVNKPCFEPLSPHRNLLTFGHHEGFGSEQRDPSALFGNHPVALPF
jgi:hypothetical protein